MSTPKSVDFSLLDWNLIILAAVAGILTHVVQFYFHIQKPNNRSPRRFYWGYWLSFPLNGLFGGLIVAAYQLCNIDLNVLLCIHLGGSGAFGLSNVLSGKLK